MESTGQARFDHAKECLLQGALLEAIDGFRHAVSLKPNFAEAYSQLGIAYRLLRKYPEAIEALTRAIELRPDDVEARYNLGRAYLGVGRLYEALVQHRILRQSDTYLAMELRKHLATISRHV